MKASDMEQSRLTPSPPKEVVAEARRLCQAHCRAKFCEDAKQCLNIWPGPGGSLHIYFAEAYERVLTKLMDTA